MTLNCSSRRSSPVWSPAAPRRCSLPASCRTARRRSFCWARLEVRAGHWPAAEQRFRTLPRQGLTQLLQPLLIAWAQQGDGRTDAALATLRPFVDGQRFRGIYALHAALIADQAGRSAEAAKLYRQAQIELGGMNLRLAQILASAQARHGHLGEAQRILAGLAADAPDMSIALPALTAASMTPPVPRAMRRDRRGLSRARGHPALTERRRLRDAAAAPGPRPAARLHRRAAAGGRHPGRPAPHRERPADARRRSPTTTR